MRSATVGTVALSIFFFVSRSTFARSHCSRGSKRVIAVPARPARAGPPDAVDVRLRLARDVVVEDVRDLLDVEAARGDVGRDEEVRRARAEALHHPVALVLREASVERLGPAAPRVQLLGDLVDLGSRPAEDDGRRGVLEVEDAREGRQLVRPGDDVGRLLHADAPVLLRPRLAVRRRGGARPEW